MPKGENFGLQGCARLEQPGHDVPDQLEEIAHHGDYRPIRRRSTIDMFEFAFPTGTRGKLNRFARHVYQNWR
jgi:hypothetical protein